MMVEAKVVETEVAETDVAETAAVGTEADERAEGVAAQMEVAQRGGVETAAVGMQAEGMEVVSRVGGAVEAAETETAEREAAEWAAARGREEGEMAMAGRAAAKEVVVWAVVGRVGEVELKEMEMAAASAEGCSEMANPNGVPPPSRLLIRNRNHRLQVLTLTLTPLTPRLPKRNGGT